MTDNNPPTPEAMRRIAAAEQSKLAPLKQTRDFKEPVRKRVPYQNPRRIRP